MAATESTTNGDVAGRAIAAARAAAGLSQAAVAERVGVKQQIISGWERGRPMRMAHLERLLEVLPDLDPLEVIFAHWPAFADRDRLRRLRELLADATDEQIETVTEIVELYVRGDGDAVTTHEEAAG